MDKGKIGWTIMNKLELTERQLHLTLKTLSSAFVNIVIQQGCPSKLNEEVIVTTMEIIRPATGLSDAEIVSTLQNMTPHSNVKCLIEEGYKYWTKYVESVQNLYVSLYLISGLREIKEKMSVELARKISGSEFVHPLKIMVEDDKGIIHEFKLDKTKYIGGRVDCYIYSCMFKDKKHTLTLVNKR